MYERCWPSAYAFPLLLAGVKMRSFFNSFVSTAKVALAAPTAQPPPTDSSSAKSGKPSKPSSAQKTESAMFGGPAHASPSPTTVSIDKYMASIKEKERTAQNKRSNISARVVSVWCECLHVIQARKRTRLQTPLTSQMLCVYLCVCVRVYISVQIELF